MARTKVPTLYGKLQRPQPGMAAARRRLVLAPDDLPVLRQRAAMRKRTARRKCAVRSSRPRPSHLKLPLATLKAALAHPGAPFHQHALRVACCRSAQGPSNAASHVLDKLQMAAIDIDVVDPLAVPEWVPCSRCRRPIPAGPVPCDAVLCCAQCVQDADALRAVYFPYQARPGTSSLTSIYPAAFVIH